MKLKRTKKLISNWWKSAEVIGLVTARFGNGGSGSVVGLLKVGRKKLFLLDEVGKCRNRNIVLKYLKNLLLLDEVGNI